MSNRMRLEFQADRIEMTLASHKVRSRVSGGTVTPRFVRYDLAVGQGTRLRRLHDLTEELALAVRLRFQEGLTYAAMGEALAFGSLLLDWNDFVQECCSGFEGDLWEYRMGLQLRDVLHQVTSSSEEPLKSRIMDVLKEPDEKFRQLLIDQRKRLDSPCRTSPDEHFWYNGVIGNAGYELRRDLIRQGWYKP